MKLHPTRFADVWIIESEPHRDDRGSFTRIFCEKTFDQHHLPTRWVQTNLSYNIHRGTLRGLHYQSAPYEEEKVVCCFRGGIYDVVLDIKPDSPSYLDWQAFELTARNHLALYIPKGYAHGFQSLEDETLVFYQMSEFYSSESAKGIRWNDPKLAIEWPISNPVVSERDQNFPLAKEIHLTD